MNKRDQKLTRREFIVRSVAGATAAGLWGKSAAWTRPDGLSESAPIQEAEKGIIHRTLGRTGFRLPVVNMGVMNALNPELVKRSYEIGVRHFDTAAYYQRGLNEAMIGKAIQELGVRDKVVIGTKVFIPHDQRPRMSSAELKKFFLDTAEGCLKRLKTDVIDIFYVHNAQDKEYLNNPGIREALTMLKDQKKVSQTGFSVHSNMTELVRDAAESGFYDVIVVAFNYSMADDADLIKALEKAQAKGIGLIAMKTQCTQYWYREYVPREKLPYYEGAISHRAVLKWALRHDFITCAIPGYTTFEQMEEVFAVASDLEYTSEEQKFLEDRNVRLALQSCCRQCGSCLLTCPKGADIPTLMRAHMYATCYANSHQAWATLAEVPSQRGLDTCRSCTNCQARCTRRVPVEKRIQELKEFYA